MGEAVPMIAPEMLARLYKRDQVRFEAFGLGTATRLLDPLEAETLQEALAETTARWSWDRGDRFAVREISERVDRLHIYAVRKKSAGTRVWRDYIPKVEHERWAEAICTVDVNVIAGIPVGAVGSEIQLHEHDQRKRPERARLERVL